MHELFLQTHVSASLSAVLATINVLEILQAALNDFGYLAVTLFIMIESSGIPFPGETMLLLSSFYAANDQHLQIPFVIICAALGAIIGDNIGYFVGRTWGKTVVERYGRYLFIKPEHIERAENFFAKHGDKTVFFGRFVAVLRAWAAFLAGVNQMKWTTFLVYNAAGGILWATCFGLLGYFAGRVFHDNFAQVEHLARNVSWTVSGIILVAVAVIVTIILYRRKNSHKARQPR